MLINIHLHAFDILRALQTSYNTLRFAVTTKELEGRREQQVKPMRQTFLSLVRLSGYHTFIWSIILIHIIRGEIFLMVIYDNVIHHNHVEKVVYAVINPFKKLKSPSSLFRAYTYFPFCSQNANNWSFQLNNPKAIKLALAVRVNDLHPNRLQPPM